MKYQRAKIKWHSSYRFCINAHFDGWDYCQDTDIPHTVLEVLAKFPDDPVVIAGWAYRVVS
jgi:hypothetical protein